MKVITSPNVYLVGKQTIIIEQMDRFLKDHDIKDWKSDTSVASQVLIEVAGRLCYMSFAKPRPGGNKAYLSHILEVGHGSVLEHGIYNFIITNISRTCTHELVRHRAGFGYSQLSQRYVDESTAEYVEPDCIANDDSLHSIWQVSVAQSHEAYKHLAQQLYEKYAKEDRFKCSYCNGYGFNATAPLKEQRNCSECKGKGVLPEKITELRKTARQAARSVLPNATETKIFVTANCRAIRHFIEMRASRFAEPEIRAVALQILMFMQIEAPNIFGDYEVTEVEPGILEAVTKNRKV